MNRFDDLLQRVSLLNAQLDPLRDRIGSEARMALHRQLWSIVEELNEEHALGLDNNALDLTVEGTRLAVRYFSGVGGSADKEVTLLIDRSHGVERHTKDLGTGNVSIT